jgi:hypothetical protein
MDKTTFGKSKSAERLAEILDELNNKKITAKVAKFLVNYNTVLQSTFYLAPGYYKYKSKYIELAQKDRIRLVTHLIEELIYIDATNRLDKMDLPDIVKSFTHNIVCYKKRYYIKCLKMMKSKK